MGSTFFESDKDKSTGDGKRSFDYYSYQAAYRRQHPERVQKWKANQAVRFLRARGYTVIAPGTDQTDTQEGIDNGRQDETDS